MPIVSDSDGRSFEILSQPVNSQYCWAACVAMVKQQWYGQCLVDNDYYTIASKYYRLQTYVPASGVWAMTLDGIEHVLTEEKLPHYAAIYEGPYATLQRMRYQMAGDKPGVVGLMVPGGGVRHVVICVGPVSNGDLILLDPAATDVGTVTANKPFYTATYANPAGGTYQVTYQLDGASILTR